MKTWRTLLPAALYVLLMLLAILLGLAACTGCNNKMTACGPYSDVPWLP